MTPEQLAAMRQTQLVLEEHIKNNYESVPQELIDAEAALRQALRENALDKMAENERELGIQMQPRCKTHPDAPHGFLRNASHSEGRYVCECEYWEPEQQPADEPVAYMSRNSHGGYSFCLSPQFFDNPEPLYTRPQPSAWVELTDEDYSALAKAVAVNKHQCRAIEAKLRELNTGEIK